jgi:two-component system response regulator FixJ
MNQHEHMIVDEAHASSRMSQHQSQRQPRIAEPIHIALIDDDEAVLDSLRIYFERRQVTTSCFATADAFLDAIDTAAPFDCVVSDVLMPGLSGLDLVRRLKGRGPLPPIILITGHGEIDMAVSAIKLGAFDFIEKPFDEGCLLDSIRDAVAWARQCIGDAAEFEQLRARFNSLSERQRQVMELAVTGLTSKEIATKLNISTKTVENHRAWVMARIGARNLVQLVRLAMQVQRLA